MVERDADEAASVNACAHAPRDASCLVEERHADVPGAGCCILVASLVVPEMFCCDLNRDVRGHRGGLQRSTEVTPGELFGLGLDLFCQPAVGVQFEKRCLPARRLRLTALDCVSLLGREFDVDDSTAREKIVW